jgi:FkbM family methyltransferase
MLSGQTLLGRILRLPLHLIPPKAEVRILRGPLRGKKWIVGAGHHACWAGTYEVDRLVAFGETISRGNSVYDVGANVGIYTLLASVKSGPTGKVFAFEPLERNLKHLRRHVMLNQMQNCKILGTAVSNVDGIRRFSTESWDFSMGRLSPEGEIEVRSVTLDSCVYGVEALKPPNVIKIDVEGAEAEVLEGATRVLSEFRPLVFVEVHGGQQHADCSALLRAKGYCIQERHGWLTATPSAFPLNSSLG